LRADAKDDENKPPKTPPSIAEAAIVGSSIDAIFDKIAEDIAKRQGARGLSRAIESLDGLVKQSGKRTISEWKRIVKRTLGIDLLDDYYRGSKFQTLLFKWVDDNVGLIKTIPRDTLGKMRQIVKEGYLSGTTTKTVSRRIQESYNVTKSRAQFIARDQIAKLNADITRQQQHDAGVSEYVWRTVNDERVRARHRELNGKRFKYSEPPIVDERTGRRANPGLDFQCRCVALPVFDLETVVLPWQSGEDLGFTYARDYEQKGREKK
jgi:SPP1 gp7 family putative phage head morphogenesis protein